jgi:hypothetical protein
MGAANFSSSDYSLQRSGRSSENAGQQSFGRFEFKYIVPDALRALLEQELAGFMEIDPFCRDRPSQTYLVRSLYFDDEDFHDYFAKIDGMLNREKFRLRAYDSPGESPCFLEIKGRQNQFSYKHRFPLDPIVIKLISKRRWSSLAVHDSNSPVIQHFAAVACRRNLLPQAGVNYTRRPYVSRRDYRFRVTFDSNLRAMHSRYFGQINAPSCGVLVGRSVIEIKFEHAIPAWFQRLIGAYELQRVSISKYCRAAEALTLVQNLE